jgi:hypothetical protein
LDLDKRRKTLSQRAAGFTPAPGIAEHFIQTETQNQYIVRPKRTPPLLSMIISDESHAPKEATQIRPTGQFPGMDLQSASRLSLPAVLP